MQFRLTSYDPICVKRSSSFPEFNFESTYIPGFNPPDEMLYQITVPMSTETELISDDMCPKSDELSDELLYEVGAQLSDEE